MKTYSSILIYLVISLFSILFLIQKAYSQTNFVGSWEGIFMNDFKAIIIFSPHDLNQFEGNIKMFAGENIIQDDKLTNINLSSNLFSFYIPDKNTSFEGSFNDQITELSGNFTFPDGSKHTIQLNKRMDDTNPLVEYRKLKEQLFKAEELISDLVFLYSSLKEYHPQLYSFTSNDSMDRLVDLLKSEIDTSFTLEEFYLIASKLTDAVHCSHTGVRLPNSYQNLANRFGNYFPYKLFFSNGKSFYVSGCTERDDPIFPGQEIISINDMPIKEIIEQTFYFIPSEAYNTTTKYNEFNKRFNELFYYLFDSEKVIVKFKSKAIIKSITVSSTSLDNIDPDYRTTENKSSIEFKHMNAMRIGMLKVPTFNIPDMNHYFFQLDSIFNDLQKTNTQNLILDFRDNNGGHPIFAAQLLSYLTNKEFVYFKRNDEVKEFEPLYNTMQPNELNYNGNIYVLINGGCLSTAGHLISLLKFNTDAIFIGEEPGSTFRCNDFSIQLTLPNTGIELNIPRTTFETAVTGFSLNEAFPIDYKVTNTVAEIINSEDTMLEKAKIIINE